MDIIKLWLHEASRVYGDKLIDEKDMETFKKIKFEAAKIGFEVCIFKKCVGQSYGCVCDYFRSWMMEY